MKTAPSLLVGSLKTAAAYGRSHVVYLLLGIPLWQSRIAHKAGYVVFLQYYCVYSITNHRDSRANGIAFPKRTTM